MMLLQDYCLARLIKEQKRNDTYEESEDEEGKDVPDFPVWE
jgi:hypothetical protein